MSALGERVSVAVHEAHVRTLSGETIGGASLVRV